MNLRIYRKQRKRIYENIIEDVALEISIDPHWREILSNAEFYKKHNISYLDIDVVPEYIRKIAFAKKLSFYVQKIINDHSEFDKDMIVKLDLSRGLFLTLPPKDLLHALFRNGGIVHIFVI